jgi:hypothetical protein
MPVEKCQDCRFYVEYAVGAYRGDCRRHAPTFLGLVRELIDIKRAGVSPNDAGWPAVYPIYFCGEFKQRDADVTETPPPETPRPPEASRT